MNIESSDTPRPDRRQALAAGALAGASARSKQNDTARPEDLYLPEEEWRDRMTAPNDGKAYGWIVDTRRCFGCHGCEVACKAENDVPLGKFIRQTVYHDHEVSRGSGVARIMVPMSCQHCEDAPCIKACPCGSMHKGPGGTVMVNYETCSGHSACKDACPYGAIYIDPVANQAVKCHNCMHRVDEAMEPPCTSTCPSDALYFGDLNDPDSRISRMAAQLEAESTPLDVLRADKNTKPRTRYVSAEVDQMESWQPKVPREGQSYGPEAYDIYNWGSDTFDQPSKGRDGQ